MTNNVCTSWRDVEEWIRDNKLERYRFSLDKMMDGERSNRMVFQYDSDDTPEENMRMAEKRLAAAAGKVIYGTGWKSKTANTGGLSVEICYTGTMMQQLQQMAAAPVSGPVVDAEKLERDLTEKITNRIRLQQFEDERKAFDAEKRAYEEEKSGVIGSLISYFAPVVKAAMAQKGMANIAGYPGSAGDVPAERIVPQDHNSDVAEVETVDPDDLPDEEAQLAYDLLKRMRKVEPDYLKLLTAVVTMAESGDSTYTMAKGFLIK